MRLLLLSSALVLVCPVAASAATVELRPSRYSDEESRVDIVMFTAAAGERNSVTASYVSDPDSEGGTWEITDATATVVAKDGCTLLAAHTASCAPVAGGRFEGASFVLGDGDDTLATTAGSTDSAGNVLAADGGSGNDQLAAGSNWWVTLSGGEGDDVLSGSARTGDVSSLFMNGGPGDDRLDGSDGTDFLDGGGGADVLYGRAGTDHLADGDRDNGGPARRPGPDRLDGGPGDDAVSYERRTAAVSVDLASDAPAGERGEHDAVVAVESASGGRGDDRIAGNNRTNHLTGGRGADRLLGRGNWDEIAPGAGADSVSCGSGRPDYVYDPRRTTLVAPDCEIVSVESGRGSYDPYPAQIRRDRIMYDVGCPSPSDSEYGSPDACEGSARLSTASSPHRVLAAAAIPRGPWVDRQARLTLPLTAAGRRLARRRHGVRAVVRMHFRDGPGAREEPALFAWMIRLKVPR